MSYSYIRRLINFINNNWIPIILIILSIYDLRLDIRLLLDFFTFSTLFYTFSDHILAITVLVTVPKYINYINND